MNTPFKMEAFCPLIDSFQVSNPEHAGDLERLEIIPEVSCNELGHAFKLPPFYLWLDSTIMPGLLGLKQRISLWLIENDHPTSDRLVNAVLAVMGAMRQRGCTSSKIVGRLQNAISTGDVSHFFVLPGTLADDGKVSLGGFTLSKLSEEPLKSRCAKAGGDFFLKSYSELRGRLCLQSPVYSRKVINLVSWLAEINGCDWHSAEYQSVLAYFEALAAMHIKMMWHDFSEKQLVHLALGSPLFPNVREIEKMLGAQPVTIYLKLPVSDGRNAGYVVPSVQTRTLVFPPLESKASHLAAMSEHYRLDQLAKAPLHPLLLNVCRSMANASSLAEEARFDESFLASIIALEQVFSNRNGIARTISGRTAALVHRQLQLGFVETAELIRRLYNLRSIFVHEGKSIPIEDRQQIGPVVQAVAKALLSLCDPRLHPTQVVRQEWLARLDAIRERLRNDEQPTATELQEAGILEPASSSNIVTP
jgi:hypothetical protein